MNFKLLKGRTRWVFIFSTCLSLAQCSKPRNEKNIKGLAKTLLYGLFYGSIQKNTVIDTRNLVGEFNSEYEKISLPNIKNIFGEDADCNDFSIVGGRSGEELYTNGPFEYYSPYSSQDFVDNLECPHLSVSLLGVNEKKISQETILGGDDIHLVYYNLPCGDVLFSKVFGTPNDDKINAVVDLSFRSLTNTPTADPSKTPTNNPNTQTESPSKTPTRNLRTSPVLTTYSHTCDIHPANCYGFGNFITACKNEDTEKGCNDKSMSTNYCCNSSYQAQDCCDFLLQCLCPAQNATCPPVAQQVSGFNAKLVFLVIFQNFCKWDDAQKKCTNDCYNTRRPRLHIQNTKQQLYEDYQASNINFLQGLCWTETDKGTKKQIAHNSIIAPVMEYDYTKDDLGRVTIDKKHESILESDNGDSTCEEAVAFFPSNTNYPLMVSTGFYERDDNSKNKVYLKISDPVLYEDRCLKIITLAKNVEIINSKITSTDNDSILMSISFKTPKGSINTKFIIFDDDCVVKSFEQYENFPLVHYITSLRQDQQNPILYPQLHDANYLVDTFNASKKYKGLVYGVASKDSKAIVFILNTTNELSVDCLKYVDNDILYKMNNDIIFASSRVLYQIDPNATKLAYYIGNIGKYTNNETVVTFTNALNCNSINNEFIIISENGADNWQGKLILQQRLVNSMIDVNITDTKYITVFSNYNTYNNTDSITGVSLEFCGTDNFLPTDSCDRFVEVKYIELKDLQRFPCQDYDNDCIEHKVFQGLNIAKNGILCSIKDSFLIACDICSNNSNSYNSARRLAGNYSWINLEKGLVCKRPMCTTKKDNKGLSDRFISVIIAIGVVAVVCLCCCCCLYCYCCLKFKVKKNAKEATIVHFLGMVELEER